MWPMITRIDRRPHTSIRWLDLHIVSDSLIKVLYSLLASTLFFKETVKQAQLQGRSFSVFLKTHECPGAVRSTYFYHFNTDFIVWNWFGYVSEFYIDHSASEVSKLINWGRNNFISGENGLEKRHRLPPGGKFFSSSTYKFWDITCWMIDIKLRDASESVSNSEIWVEIIKISRSDSTSTPVFSKKKVKVWPWCDPASRFLWKEMYLHSKESKTFINSAETIGRKVIWFLSGPPHISRWRSKCISALCEHFFNNHYYHDSSVCYRAGVVKNDKGKNKSW